MHFLASFLVLAIGGLVDASYLTYKHYRKQPLVCPIGGGCEAVTTSRWSNLFGVRNEILGLAYYAAILVGGIVFAVMPDLRPQLATYIHFATGAGLLFSLFLTGIQAFIIKNYCFYCLLSAVISVLLFVNSFALAALV